MFSGGVDLPNPLRLQNAHALKRSDVATKGPAL